MTFTIPQDHYMNVDKIFQSGEVLALDAQYQRWLPEKKALFEPIQVEPGVTMWRYKGGTVPWMPKRINDRAKLNPADEVDQFFLVVHNFIDALSAAQTTHLVDGDEDEEYTYGAFSTACATYRVDESDWLLERIAGSLWQMTHINVMMEEYEDQS